MVAHVNEGDPALGYVQQYFQIHHEGRGLGSNPRVTTNYVSLVFNGSTTVSKTASGGSNPSGYAKQIAGIQGIGQSHKLGLVSSNLTSATSFRMHSANIITFWYKVKNASCIT